MAVKKFDVDGAVSAALALFWESGYTATSIQQIVAATGLKPGSIYHEFGSKEELFKLCLAQYADHSIHSVTQTINNSETVLQGIRKVLADLIDSALEENYCGCFLIKSQLELSVQNNDAYQFCLLSLQRIEANFTCFLSQEFPDDLAKAYANQLMLVIFGIRVLGYQQTTAQNLPNTYQPLLPWLYPQDQ